MSRRLWVLVGLIVGLGATIAIGAEWMGFWGADEWPGTEAIEPGRWSQLPICWDFNSTGSKDWTTAEKDVARAAIAEWNQREIQDVDNPLSGQIHEASDPACQGRATDIELKLEAPPNDGLVGLYTPERLAKPIREAMGGELCDELKQAGTLDRCSVILLEPNSNDGWFVDPTPTRDEEFETSSVQKCGETKEMSQAKPGGPADGKQDLFTIMAHEFGHALGLIHTGGCDDDPRTPTDPTNLADDDGKLMWGGLFLDRRGRGSSSDIGLSQRRRPDAPTGRALSERYAIEADEGQDRCLSEEFEDFANRTFGEQASLQSGWHNNHEVGLRQFAKASYEDAIENFEVYLQTLQDVQVRLTEDADGNGTSDLVDRFGVTDGVRSKLNQAIASFAKSVTAYEDFVRLRKSAAQAFIAGNPETAEQLVDQSNQAVDRHVDRTDETVAALKEAQNLLEQRPCRPSPSTQIIKPSDLAAATSGQRVRIEWTAENLNPEGTFEVWYRTPDGVWQLIQEREPGPGSLTWTVPEVETTGVGRLWVGNLTNPDGETTEEQYEAFHETKLRFLPEGPAPMTRITTPSQRDTLSAGQQVEIEWEASNLDPSGTFEVWVKLGDGNWEKLHARDPSPGTFTWTAPEVAEPTSAQIWVGNLTNPEGSETVERYEVFDQVIVPIVSR